MLSLIGFGTICVFLILIISKKLSVITALVIVPVLMAVLAGFNATQMGTFALEGIKQVAPTGILLMFAVLYFAVMLDTGLFDPIINLIIEKVKGDPVKVLMGTALLTMLVHLDGDGTATFMIVISAFLPVYKELKIKKLYLACIVALAVGPIHLVPWSGTSARAISTLNTEANLLFNPNLPAIFSGICWVLFVAYFLGKKERKRLGIKNLAYKHSDNLSDEQKQMRRPKLLLLNALLTIGLISALMMAWVPAPVLFVIAAMTALLINYPKQKEQSYIMKSHGANIFMVTGLIFAAGIFSGILNGSGMINAMASTLVEIIPDRHANLLPLFTAISSTPASLLFTPDAYYYGIIPVFRDAAISFGLDPLEIGRAALLGQMTVGFPISPLTASTFLLIGLCEVELGEHQKTTFLWACGTTIVMTITALFSGSISI